MEKLSQGGQEKRYKDTLWAFLKNFDLPTWRLVNRLHRSDQSGEVHTKEQHSMKKEKKAQRTQGQVQWAISGFHDIDLLEWAKSAIKELTNSHLSLI